MSNYTLTSPVDVTSTGASQIQLYDASGTNSVTLAAPTLTSNVTFPLPSNAGVAGQYFQAIGTSASWTSNIYTQPSGTTLPLSYRLSAGALPAAGISIGTTPTIIGYFMFPGSTVAIPSYATITIGLPSASGFARIRMNDVTNGNVTVMNYAFTSTTGANPPRSFTSPLLTFTNLPTTPAVFAILLFSSNGMIPFFAVHIS